MKFKNRFSFFSLLSTLGAISFITDGGEGGGSADGGEGAAAAAGNEGTPSPLIGDDLTFAEDWQSRVGENAEGLTFKSLSDMAKSSKEGSAKIQQLGTEKADLMKQIETLSGGKGADIPNTVEAYAEAVVLPDAANLPEGVVIPQTMVDAGIAFAMEKGYPPSVVSDFITFQANQAGEEFAGDKATLTARIEESKAIITNIVGPQELQNTISDAQAASEVLGLDLDPDDLVSNPRLVVALSKVKDQLSPGTLKGAGLGSGDNSSAQGKLSQAEAILSDPSNKYYDAWRNSDHVDHERAVAHYNQLILESGGGA